MQSNHLLVSNCVGWSCLILIISLKSHHVPELDIKRQWDLYHIVIDWMYFEHCCFTESL